MTFGTFNSGAGIVRTGYKLAITGVAGGTYTYTVTWNSPAGVSTTITNTVIVVWSAVDGP